ncbi:hypothetical protein AUR59_018360 [Stutzerimonas balearica]|nr:hypothetical protein AUR59_018360 [Stutzerimonas balearica]
MKDVVAGAIINGSFNIVDIVADNCNSTGLNNKTVITVAGNCNIVRVVATDVKQPSNEIIVSGNKNTLDLILETDGTKGLVLVTGTGNRVRGNCNIHPTSASANDFTGVTGWEGAGVASVTTDASGIATIPVTAAVATMFADVRYVGTDFNHMVYVRSTSATSIVVQVRTSAGATVNSTALALRYQFQCYK